MPSLLGSLLEGPGLMPHGMCYLWRPELLWLHVASDALVAGAYYAIPPALLFFTVRSRRLLADSTSQRRGGIPYDWVFLAFGVFIVACGTTHLLAVVTVWKPIYWISGSAKVVTAMASVATAVALPPLIPRALTLVKAARDNERHRLQLEDAHRALKEAHGKLTELDRVKSGFFTDASHGLRTPLTLILGPAQQLAESEDLEDGHRRKVDLILRTATDLLGSVDALLTVAALESGGSKAGPEIVGLASPASEGASDAQGGLLHHPPAHARPSRIRASSLPPSWREGDTRPRVLIVEGNPDLREYLGEILSGDFSCAGVANGTAALPLARDGRPDLIVTDLNMPGMSGEAFLETVRADPRLAHVPVLVLTARTEPGLPARLLTLGAEDLLVTPVRADELLARAHNLVSLSETRWVLRAALGSVDAHLPSLSRRVAQQNRDLAQALRAKEVLLQELHHRVKGNLQTVASLLNLQLGAVSDPAARDALADSKSRVRAIALLHERLYQGGDPGEVEMAEYLRGLASELGQAALPNGAEHPIRVHAQPVDLDVERAVACGIVAHELLANALEHGSAPGRPPDVSLSLVRQNGDVVLNVSDRGPGLGEATPDGGLGLRLVESLVRRLGGEALRYDDDGLHWTVRFPLLDSPPTAGGTP